MDTKFNKFIESIKIGNIDEAKSKFVFEYLNKEDKYGLKPIHWACLSSNMEILEWMLQENCNIETPSRNGWRPLHFASFAGNEEMVLFLINKTCRYNSQTDNGETVLDVANGYFNHDFMDEILNENINLKIGLSMGLKCGGNCDHKFCLRSLIQCKFDKNNVVRKKQLESGLRVKDSHSDRYFIVKIIKICNFDNYPNEKSILPHINQILPSSNHPNIVKWFGMIKTEMEVMFFMKWMNNRSLCKEIKSNKRFSCDKIGRYCKDILQAVAYLHDNKILHRFVHLTNMFYDNNGGCKLAIANYSYSLANGDVQIDDEWLSNYYNFSLTAPELVNNGILSYPYDIFWLGYTVTVMFTGNYNNYKFNKCDDFEKLIPKISNKLLQSFIKRMVLKDPTKRATANELLNHEFIRNIPIDNLTNNLSTIDNSHIKCNNLVNVIHNAINDKKIGSSMRLKCNNKTKHNNNLFYFPISATIECPFWATEVLITAVKELPGLATSIVKDGIALIRSAFRWNV